eukprot:1432627-Rhodomonas_salina.2
MDASRGIGGGQVKARPRQQHATISKSSSHAQMRASEFFAARKSQTEGQLPFLPVVGVSTQQKHTDGTLASVSCSESWLGCPESWLSCPGSGLCYLEIQLRYPEFALNLR